jgi:hypothetical protein
MDIGKKSFTLSNKAGEIIGVSHWPAAANIGPLLATIQDLRGMIVGVTEERSFQCFPLSLTKKLRYSANISFATDLLLWPETLQHGTQAHAK